MKTIKKKKKKREREKLLTDVLTFRDRSSRFDLINISIEGTLLADEITMIQREPPRNFTYLYLFN